jgi:hypothetical protein
MWRSTLAQTASNNATALLVNAFDLASEEGRTEFFAAHDAISEHIFARLDAVAATDDAKFEERAEKPASGGSKSYSKKTGGGKGGSGKVTLEGALSLELNSGAFKGATMGDVLALDAATCDEQYGYGDGERNGRDYIGWLATDRNRNDFTRARAAVIAEAEGIEVE